MPSHAVLRRLYCPLRPAPSTFCGFPGERCYSSSPLTPRVHKASAVTGLALGRCPPSCRRLHFLHLPQQQQQQYQYQQLQSTTCFASVQISKRLASSSSAAAAAVRVFPPALRHSPSSIAGSSSSEAMPKRSREDDFVEVDGPGGTATASAAATTTGARLTKHELYRVIAARLTLPEESVAYVVEQTKQGATVPFLARYRQDETNHLAEDQIRAVIATSEEVAEVQRRRQFMLTSLEQRGLLTDEVRQALMQMAHVSQLEDFWEPFKVRKTSLAGRARDAGLGSLAEWLLHKPQPLPGDAKRTIGSVEDGERLFVALVAEELQRCEPARQALLAGLQDTGSFVSSVVKSARKKSAKELRDEAFDLLKKKFSFYDGKRYGVNKVNSHTMLALLRGEAKGVLKVDFHTPNEQALRGRFQALVETHFQGVRSRKVSMRAHFGTHSTAKVPSHGAAAAAAAPAADYSPFERQMLVDGLQAAFSHMLKSASNTIRRDIKKSAEREAIAVFAHNLRHMLLQRPLSHARVLAMDPGLSNGVKCVALDEGGDVIAFFKCNLMEEARMMEYIAKIVETKRLNKIVIGNGTASQQTAHVVARTIARQKWTDVEFAIVSEAGASVYSVSDTAKEEFPSLDIMYRGAVSIGRRVMDPLSELVKIPVRSMGIGMYQHDVNEKELLTELGHVVESCVAAVGVNSASTNRYVMEKVPGIQKKLVDQIVLARHAKRLTSREDLRKVPGMTEAVYNQVAGFFRFPNSSEPLDNTNIHPESYGLVRQVLAMLDKGGLGPITQLGSKVADEAARRRQAGLALASLSEQHFRSLVRQLGCGSETLRMVGEELLHPALDPRASLPHAGLLRKEIKTPEDCKPGDRLDGIVSSITTFGAFVDCGFHDSVLVRGNVDLLQVGMLLTGIVFTGLDHLGRPQVQYTPPPVPHKGKDAGASRGGRKGLRLEADDIVSLDGPALGLHAQLALTRQAAEKQKQKGLAEQTARGSGSGEDGVAPPPPSTGRRFASQEEVKRPREAEDEEVAPTAINSPTATTGQNAVGTEDPEPTVKRAKMEVPTPARVAVAAPSSTTPHPLTGATAGETASSGDDGEAGEGDSSPSSVASASGTSASDRKRKKKRDARKGALKAKAHAAARATPAAAAKKDGKAPVTVEEVFEL